jgi:hypothetical protein
LDVSIEDEDCALEDDCSSDDVTEDTSTEDEITEDDVSSESVFVVSQARNMDEARIVAVIMPCFLL